MRPFRIKSYSFFSDCDLDVFPISNCLVSYHGKRSLGQLLERINPDGVVLSGGQDYGVVALRERTEFEPRILQ